LGIYQVFTWVFTQVNTQVNVPEVPEVYLLEGFYVLPTRKSAKFHGFFEKIRNKMGNNPVGNKVNTLKGKYLGKYLFTFRIRFLLEPYL